MLRSFGEPRDGREAEWAARDRSPLWGAIQVTEIAPAGATGRQ
ncbi:MAG TPA: hypothetical protein VKK31_04295 [Thermoanaerobaculia bacterium]|nr:hypothetical protein [Thermoanaerobaculia bacterium]